MEKTPLRDWSSSIYKIMSKIRSERYLTRSLSAPFQEYDIHEKQLEGAFIMNVVYMSDLTVMLFSVWSQAGSFWQKKKEKFKNILASILLTLYCNVTLL